MGFAVGSLAVMSGFRPSELLSLSRLSALIELRSMLLAVVAVLVTLVLAYLTNPSETSFRAFLTEQAFRHHLSRLDDVESQDEGEVAGSSSGADLSSKQGVATYKRRSSDSYASPPFPFASRASVSLRTPKHIFRSYGILSIAAVVPSQPNQSLSARTHDDSERAQKSIKEMPRIQASLTSDSWFIGMFGMWFWAANFDGLWKDAGMFAKDEVDGTMSGVLEIKALDRFDEMNCNTYASNVNLSYGQQRRALKLRSRDQLTHQNGLVRQRSQSPPPLPKSASLPLHTKRGSPPIASDKHLHGPHFSSPAPSASSSSSNVQPSPPAIVSDARSITPISTAVNPAVGGASNDTISRSPSTLFGSSPLIAEISKQLSASQSTIADLRAQLSDFHASSTSASAALEQELESHRSRKRSDDASRTELKTQIKHLEDHKRVAEGTRRDAEKRLKAVNSERDNTIAKTEHFEREIRDIHAQIETHGAATVASTVESAALTADLESQIEAKRVEIRDVEDEIAQLGMTVREIEEKISIEEKRLEQVLAVADLRKQEQDRKAALSKLQGERLEAGDDGAIPDDAYWRTPPQLQIGHPEMVSSEMMNHFQSSPCAVSAPTSPLSTVASEPAFHRLSSQTMSTDIPTNAPASLARFPVFKSETSSLHTLTEAQTSVFAPFSDNASSSIISPTSESLLPSSLFESLGMGNPNPDSSESPATLAPALSMDVSRSFQSDDDVILDRNWLRRQNGAAGGVGQRYTHPTLASSGNALSSSLAADGPFEREAFDPHMQQRCFKERDVSLHMDTQHAVFPTKSFATDYAPRSLEYPDVFPESSAEPILVRPNVPRRPGWFSSSKEKDSKAQEKKGLNPDAKEFSLSKDKERSFSALLSRSRASAGSTSSGSSSTPSSASPSTSDSYSILSTPSSIMAPPAQLASPLLSAAQSRKSVPARAASSLLSLGSSWFGSRAFAPTPMEREQLSRVLGSTANMSLDRLPSFQTCDTPYQQQTTQAQNNSNNSNNSRPSPPSRSASMHSYSASSGSLLPMPVSMSGPMSQRNTLPIHQKWETAPSCALGSVLLRTSSSFCPFADDEAKGGVEQQLLQKQTQHDALTGGGNVRASFAEHADGDAVEPKLSNPVSRH